MSQNPYYQDPQYQPSYAQQPQGPYGQPYQPGAYMSVPEKKPEPSTVVKTGIYLIFGYALYALVSSIYNSVTLRGQDECPARTAEEPVLSVWELQ